MLNKKKSLKFVSTERVFVSEVSRGPLVEPRYCTLESWSTLHWTGARFLRSFLSSSISYGVPILVSA